MSNVLEEGFSGLVFNDHIRHVFGDEVVHVLAPNVVDIVVGQVAIQVLVRCVRFLNLLITHHLLSVLLGHHFIAILGCFVFAHFS